jgi:hypothetical protein
MLRCFQGFILKVNRDYRVLILLKLAFLLFAKNHEQGTFAFFFGSLPDLLEGVAILAEHET